MTTPSTALVAIAASTAWPPRRQDRQPGRGREVVRRDDGAVRPAGERAPGPGAVRRSCAVARLRASRARRELRMLLDRVGTPGARSCASGRSARRAGRASRRAGRRCRAVRREAADQAADDLADREEDRVEAHDRAAVGREALGHVGQQAERRGVAPARTNRPAPADARRASGRAAGRPPPWLTTQRRRHDAAAAEDPVEDDRRPPQRLEPVAPVDQAGPEDDADRRRPRARSGSAWNPCIRTWSGNFGFASRELEDRLAEPQADRRVDRDPGRCQEPDVRRAEQGGVAAEIAACVVAAARRLPARRPGDPRRRSGRSGTSTPYTRAFRKNAAGPSAAKSSGATTRPTPRPASVAPSNRAAALPRRTSLPAVTRAM